MDCWTAFWSAVSRAIHDLTFDGPSQTLCARAWEYRHRPFWRVWVRIFGEKHCREGYEHWRGRG